MSIIRESEKSSFVGMYRRQKTAPLKAILSEIERFEIALSSLLSLNEI
jgi:hypothetical protein